MSSILIQSIPPFNYQRIGCSLLLKWNSMDEEGPSKLAKQFWDPEKFAGLNTILLASVCQTWWPDEAVWVYNLATLPLSKTAHRCPLLFLVVSALGGFCKDLSTRRKCLSGENSHVGRYLRTSVPPWSHRQVTRIPNAAVRTEGWFGGGPWRPAQGKLAGRSSNCSWYSETSALQKRVGCGNLGVLRTTCVASVCLGYHPRWTSQMTSST